MVKRVRRTILCICCNQPGPMSGRGLRMSCYQHWRALGELSRFTKERSSPAEHGARLRAQYGDSNCWPWPEDKVNSGGYGRHRAIFEALVGPVADGLELDHLCRVRACCNPAHLEPVPRRVNLARGRTLVRRNLARTHCPQGHPYSEENTYWRKAGRDCLTCRRTRTAARNKARKDGVPYVDPFKVTAVSTEAPDRSAAA